MQEFMSLAIAILTVIASWRVFQKLGEPGWAALIPFYNAFVLCRVLFGSGWTMLFLLIPIFNIYYSFKINLYLARGFGKGVGFACGLFFLAPIFLCILGFGNLTFRNGELQTEELALEGTVFNVKRKLNAGAQSLEESTSEGLRKLESANIRPQASLPKAKNQDTLDLLKELQTLRETGVLTEEEFNKKKAELLERL